MRLKLITMEIIKTIFFGVKHKLILHLLHTTRVLPVHFLFLHRVASFLSSYAGKCPKRSLLTPSVGRNSNDLDDVLAGVGERHSADIVLLDGEDVGRPLFFRD